MDRNPLLMFLIVLGMVVGGIILLLPGLCGLVLIPAAGLGPGSIMLWLSCVGISVLGAWLIVKGFS